jgi:hydrogenase nickel incorporation protein HypA/HybF
MHELSIAASIVEIATEEAAKHGGRVEIVYLKLGAMSGVVKDALLFSWDLACVETPIEGAKLEVEDAEGGELQVTALEIGDRENDTSPG